jgi:hypothetical protein
VRRVLACGKPKATQLRGQSAKRRKLSPDDFVGFCFLVLDHSFLLGKPQNGVAAQFGRRTFFSLCGRGLRLERVLFQSPRNSFCVQAKPPSNRLNFLVFLVAKKVNYRNVGCGNARVVWLFLAALLFLACWRLRGSFRGLCSARRWHFYAAMVRTGLKCPVWV